MNNYFTVVSVENLQVEQDLISAFSVRKSLHWGFISHDPKTTWNFLAKTVIFSFLCVYCGWVDIMCESILGGKALNQIICCGLGNLCGIGWQWDEGLIDRYFDWKCNPSLPLSVCHRPQSGLFPQRGHSTQQQGSQTIWDVLMAATWCRTMVATKMQVHFIWKLQKLGPVRWVDLFTELFSWWLKVGKEHLHWSDNDKTLVFHFTKAVILTMIFHLCFLGSDIKWLGTFSPSI